MSLCTFSVECMISMFTYVDLILISAFCVCCVIFCCNLPFQITVVPRIMTLIRSSEIAVEQKRRNAKIKSALKRIETLSVRSSGLETHHPVKILHRVAIFGACAAMNPSQKTVGSHFIRQPF